MLTGQAISINNSKEKQSLANRITTKLISWLRMAFMSMVLMLAVMGVANAAVISVKATVAAAAEPSNNGMFTVNSDVPAPAGGLAVNLIVGGTATPSQPGTKPIANDYERIAAQIVIPARTTSVNVPVKVNDDRQEEQTETVTLTIAKGLYTIGAANSATVRIADDEKRSTIEFTALNYSVNEDVGSAVVSVKRIAGTGAVATAAASVSFAATAGTATAGSDFQATKGNLSWAAGDLADKTFTVQIANDQVVETAEDIILALGSPTGATLGKIGKAKVTINDNDVAAPGVINYKAKSYSVAENGGSAQITLSRTGGSAGPLSIDFATANGTATAGSDYTAVRQTVAWKAGDTADKVVSIPILDDRLVEKDETVNLSFKPTGDSKALPKTSTLTITENDVALPGVIDFKARTYSVSEAGAAAKITLARSGGSAGALSVDFSTSNGTASAGSDYTAVKQTIVWKAGEITDKVVSIPILEDKSVEKPETVNLAIIPSGDLKATPKTAVLTINDNDVAQPGVIDFKSRSYSVTEGGGAAKIVLSRIGGSAGSLSVEFSTANGTATGGSDYSSVKQTVAWAAGDIADKVVNVPILEDTVVEQPETVNLSIIPSGITKVSPKTAVLTINDNDVAAPGVINFNAKAYSVSENGGSAKIILSRTGGSAGALSVDFVTSNGTAVASSDYTAVKQTVAWKAGDTLDKVVNIPILDDKIVEANETVNLAFRPSGDLKAAFKTSVLTIVENDQPSTGTIQFKAKSYSVAENGKIAQILLARVGGSDGPLSIDFTTANGTATAGSDYSAVTQTLAWKAGEVSDKVVNIPILDDGVAEDNEIVNLAIKPSGITKVSPSNSTLVIVDNDKANPGVIDFKTKAFTVVENQATAQIVLSRIGGSEGALSVDFSTSNGSASAGQDYTAAKQSVAWKAGDVTDKTISITILNDSVAEKDETVNLSLLPTGVANVAPVTAVLTIKDDEQTGTIDFKARTFSVSEGDKAAQIVLSRSGGSSGAIAINFTTSDGTAMAGSDYTATKTTIQWAAGDSADKTVLIPMIDDALVESDETVQLSITPQDTGRIDLLAKQAVLSISDNETVPVAGGAGAIQLASADYSVNENARLASIQVVRSGGSAGAASVRYATSDATATAGSDYSATSGVINWNDGEQGPKVIQVALLDDTETESNETFTVRLSQATAATLGALNTATVTITDVEAAGVVQFKQANYSVSEAGAAAVITVTRVGGSTGPVSVNYAAANGSAIAGSDYTDTKGSLTWGDGDASDKQFQVPVLTDANDQEGNETVQLSLSNPSANTGLGNPAQATLTITDVAIVPPETVAPGETNVPLPTQPSVIQLMQTRYQINEQANSVRITLQRGSGTNGAVSVRVETVNGSATAGADYQAVSRQVSWPDGDSTNKVVDIPILNDSDLEGDESFTVRLTAVSGAQLGSQTEATVALGDDEVGSGSLSRLGGEQGETIAHRFKVSSADAGISIQAQLGTVQPQFIAGTSDSVTYRLDIPPDAAPGDVITDTITVTDGAQKQTTVAVNVVVREKLAEIQNLNQTQAAVAEAVDTVCAGTESDSLRASCDQIDALPEEQQRTALDSIAPVEVAVQGSSAVEVTAVQITNVRTRLTAVRGGARGFSVNGFSVSLQDDDIPLGALAESGLHHVGGGAAGDQEGRLGVFVNGRVNFGEKDATEKEGGYDFDTQGITFGADYRINDRLFLGGALGLSVTESDYSDGSGGLDIDTTTASIYGSYYKNDSFYLDWIFSLGKGSYDTRRNINIGSVASMATGDTDGSMQSLSLNAGMDYPLGEWLISPYIRADMINVEIDAYDESGGAGFALRIEDQSVDSLTLALGSQISKPMSFDWGVLIPGVDLAFEHEFKDDGRLIRSSLIEDPRAVFQIATDDPDRSYYNLGLSVAAQFASGKGAFLRFDTVLGQDDFSNYTLEAGYRMEF